jgi:predicted nucleic acid-binding protein
MKVLETSYLVDYEQGLDSAKSYFERNEDESMAASTVSMFELAFGVVWDSNGSLTTLRESLVWVDFLDLSVADAIEAARIQAELQSSGDRIPIGDLLVAGVARNRGATLVGADDHFEWIEGLSVENHRTK